MERSRLTEFAARSSRSARTLWSATLVAIIFASTWVVGCSVEESTSRDATHAEAVDDAGAGTDACSVESSSLDDCPQTEDECGPCCRAWTGLAADSTRRCITHDGVRLACVPSGWESSPLLGCFVLPDGTLVRTPNIYSFGLDIAELGLTRCSDVDRDWVMEVSWCG